MPASLPVSQALFGYWFWLLVPDEIMGRFLFSGLYLYQLYQLMVSSTPKGQAAGSLCLCHVCAESRAVHTMTNGSSWIMSVSESLSSKSELLGKRPETNAASPVWASFCSFISLLQSPTEESQIPGKLRLQNGLGSNHIWNTAHIFPLIKEIL